MKKINFAQEFLKKEIENHNKLMKHLKERRNKIKNRKEFLKEFKKKFKKL